MIQANAPIAITMPAQNWETVLEVLRKIPAPHFVTDPLIREILAQCMREDRPDNVTALRDLEAGC